ERRARFTGRKLQPLFGRKVVVPLPVVTLESRLTIDGLPGAYESQARIAEHDAVIGVPAAQHGAGYFGGDAADRGTRPDPSRRRISDPGLLVIFVDVFDLHAADLIGQIMILRACDGVRQIGEAELAESGQEFR